MKIGKFDGVFHLDEKNRKIHKVEVFNADSLETNFPGSTKEDFNYLKLESIMKYYMDLENEETLTLTDVIDKIIDEGFFFGLRPSLRIEVERV